MPGGPKTQVARQLRAWSARRAGASTAAALWTGIPGRGDQSSKRRRTSKPSEGIEKQLIDGADAIERFVRLALFQQLPQRIDDVLNNDVARAGITARRPLRARPDFYFWRFSDQTASIVSERAVLDGTQSPDTRGIETYFL